MKLLLTLLSLSLYQSLMAGGSFGTKSIIKALPQAGAVVEAKIVKSRVIAVFDHDGVFIASDVKDLKIGGLYTLIHCADLRITKELYGNISNNIFNKSDLVSITWTGMGIIMKDGIQCSDCPHVSKTAQAKQNRIWTLVEKNRRWTSLSDSDTKVLTELIPAIKKYKKENSVVPLNNDLFGGE